MFSITMVMLVIFLALIFDFINGFHDTANAVATAVSTKAIKPYQAIAIAAFFNFAGALSGTAVASTIGKNIIAPDLINPLILIAALIGAIFWNIFTWYFGIPSSSSHALIGGLIGAIIAGFGINCIKWYGLGMIIAGLIISPLAGFIAGDLVMILLFLAFKNNSPVKINNNFRKLQVISSCMASFAHGSNDAQKSMAVITMALVSAGLLTVFQVPIWVKIICAFAIACGTAVGGWKIIKTMGQKLYNIEPINGFAADLTSSIVVYSASLLGFPVSTTHVISSSIMGVGAAKRFKGMRWSVANKIIIAWFITIPASALAAMGTYDILLVIT